MYDGYGISAIYRGVSASICGNFIGAVTTMVTEEVCGVGLGFDQGPLPYMAPLFFFSIWPSIMGWATMTKERFAAMSQTPMRRNLLGA